MSVSVVQRIAGSEESYSVCVCERERDCVCECVECVSECV